MLFRLPLKVLIWQQKIDMRESRLYVDQDLKIGNKIALLKDKAHYVTNVKRLRIGGLIKLFNNSGKEFDAKLIVCNKKEVLLEIKDSKTIDNESKLKITLGLGVSRNRCMDYAIQKAVELGVSKITPLLTSFSHVEPTEDKKQDKLSHWRNIIISASEQCGRTRLTELDQWQSLQEYVQTNFSGMRLFFSPRVDSCLEQIEPSENELQIVIGSEGGFSQEEIKIVKEHGFYTTGLGSRVLRTETAVVTALSICQYKWGDLK